MAVQPEMQEYLRRWQALEEIEGIEMQHISVELRFKQLIAIINLARTLGLAPEENQEDSEAVRARWMKLKRQ
jgi:hypothetical protein